MHTKSMDSIHTTSCSLHSGDTITRVVYSRGLILLRIVVICMGLVCIIYIYAYKINNVSILASLVRVLIICIV